MVRMTKRDKRGEPRIDFNALGKPFGADTVYDVFDLYHIACDHLAAYEDTDLTPAEVEAMKAENASLKAELDDPRTVRLPCKVGDTVFSITRKGIEKDIIDSFEISNRVYYTTEKMSLGGGWLVERFGKTVFLSPEEAEKAKEARESNV